MQKVIDSHYTFLKNAHYWSKLTTADRSVTVLASFKSRIHKRDLNSLLDDGCRGLRSL